MRLPQYSIELTPDARSELAKIAKGNKAAGQRITTAIEALATNPRPNGSQPLRGDKSVIRIRVGDYRILYTVENKKLVIVVVAIGHRREVYR